MSCPTCYAAAMNEERDAVLDYLRWRIQLLEESTRDRGREGNYALAAAYEKKAAVFRDILNALKDGVHHAQKAQA